MHLDEFAFSEMHIRLKNLNKTNTDSEAGRRIYLSVN